MVDFALVILCTAALLGLLAYAALHEHDGQRAGRSLNRMPSPSK